jgi:hypothetical protein
LIVLSPEPTGRHDVASTRERRVRADLTSVFGSIVCLTHDTLLVDDAGALVGPGDLLTAYDRDRVATGTVDRAPGWLPCRGARWVLKLDTRGIRRADDETRRDTPRQTPR